MTSVTFSLRNKWTSIWLTESFREVNLEVIFIVLREAKNSFPRIGRFTYERKKRKKNPFDYICLINVWFQLVKYWKSSMYDMNLVNRLVTKNRGRRKNKQRIVKVSFVSFIIDWNSKVFHWFLRIREIWTDRECIQVFWWLSRFAMNYEALMKLSKIYINDCLSVTSSCVHICVR